MLNPSVLTVKTKGFRASRPSKPSRRTATTHKTPIPQCHSWSQRRCALLISQSFRKRIRAAMIPEEAAAAVPVGGPDLSTTDSTLQAVSW